MSDINFFVDGVRVKEGDLIIIKDDIVAGKSYGDGGKHRSGVYLNEDMLKYRGQSFRVCRLTMNDVGKIPVIILEGAERWRWSPEMIEAVIPQSIGGFSIGDRVMFGHRRGIVVGVAPEDHTKDCIAVSIKEGKGSVNIFARIHELEVVETKDFSNLEIGDILNFPDRGHGEEIISTYCDDGNKIYTTKDLVTGGFRVLEANSIPKDTEVT